MECVMDSNTTSTWPRELTAYETSDRQLFQFRDVAEHHQRQLDGAAHATALLESGASLGEALRQGGFLRGCVMPELDEVFATTKLVIEHWQCRSQPGYQPRRVTCDGEVFVHGDAGSWSGSYGSICTASDVVRYWRDTKRRAQATRMEVASGR
jgi:hypothetical protein